MLKGGVLGIGGLKWGLEALNIVPFLLSFSSCSPSHLVPFVLVALVFLIICSFVFLFLVSSLQSQSWLLGNTCFKAKAGRVGGLKFQLPSFLFF